MIIIADTNVEEEVERNEQAQLVQEAIGKMDKLDREIFLRHYYYYQSVIQIAEEIQMNPSTVKTRLKRGREKLKVVLQDGR